MADSINFKIGVATSPGSEYHALIAEEFNSIVGENHFKPSKLLTDAANWKSDFSNADELMEFVESNGMRMRGHALIWGKFAGRTYPKNWGKQITEASDKKQVMEAIMTRCINTTMSHFKGRVSTFDVVNEPMDGLTLFPSPFTEALDEKYIDLAFRLARDADPECSLFLNEQIGDYDGPSGKAFLSLLERLKARNGPSDGVGLQSQHLNRMHDLDALKRYIRTNGKLGLKVEITELDIRLLLLDNEDDPYAAQGLQYGGITKLCLDDPACNGLTLWGLTDEVIWMDQIPPFKWKSPNASNIYDEEMRKKPAYLEIWKVLKNAGETN